MAKSTAELLRKSRTLPGLHDHRGAFTSIRDLIHLRYAAREIDDLLDNKAAGPLAGLLTSSFHGRGIDFAEVRVYQPGDDVRTIDWRVTARTRVAHTKLFQEEKERPVLFLVDQSASMYFGSQVTFKSVLAARTAALLAWALLARGNRVGGIVFSDKGYREVRPRRNRHAVLRLLHEIHDFNHALKQESAAREPKDAEQYLTTTLANARRLAKDGSIIYIISDFTSYTPASRTHLQPLARHNDLVGVHISDPLERALPSPGLYSITNGTLRARINTASSRHRDAYAKEFESRLSIIEEEFMRVKSRLITLQTGQSLMHGLSTLQGAAS